MDCTVIGDVLFDVLVNVDHSELELTVGGTCYSSPILMDFGGIGNVAVGLSRLGGKVHLIGKAGKDFLGYLYQKNLKTERVSANVSFSESNPTGICLTFVNETGERSFFVSRGANDFLLPLEIETFKQEIIKSNYLFISGHSVVRDPQKEAVFKAVQIARSENVKVIFDPGSYNLVKQNCNIFQKLIGLSDVVIPNLDEAIALTNCTQIEDILRNLSKKVPLTALKMGKEGCIYY